MSAAQRWLRSPDLLFLFVSALAGLALTFLVTPLAGGNEVANFQRAATIANGEWRVRPALLPAGIVDFLSIADERFSEGSKPPFDYSEKQWRRIQALQLGADRPTLVEPNAIAVLHPFAYLPQVPAIAAAQAVGAPPLAIFYTGRLSGLFVAILLTFLAIRLVPARRYALAALALLPPMTFARSTLDADQFNSALALLFTALALRAALTTGRIRTGEVAALAVSAFLLAQAKSAYLLMPLLVFAIPAARFTGPRQRWTVCAVVTLPGAIASMAWIGFLKVSAFTAARYSTWSGAVEPDRQLALVLDDPVGFVGTLLRTLFTTELVPRSALDLFGTFGPPVMMALPLVIGVIVLFALVVLSEQGPRLPMPPARAWRWLSTFIIVATVGLILCLLYLQWTRVGGRVVDGWNARYLFPLGLLLLLLPRGPSEPLYGARPERWLLALAFVGVGATLWTTVQTYHA